MGQDSAAEDARSDMKLDSDVIGMLTLSYFRVKSAKAEPCNVHLQGLKDVYYVCRFAYARSKIVSHCIGMVISK